MEQVSDRSHHPFGSEASIMEKAAAGFQHARDQRGQASMLLGIECFNPKVEMTKSALSGGKSLARVILDEFDPVGRWREAFNGGTMHAGGDVDGMIDPMSRNASTDEARPHVPAIRS